MKIKGCKVSSQKHLERKEIYGASAASMEYSIRLRLSYADETAYDIEHRYPLMKFANRKSNGFTIASEFEDLPFGAVGTMRRSGCLVFTAYNMLYVLGKRDYSVAEIREAVVKGGYRMWKFENRKPVFGWPTITLCKAKKAFSSEAQLQECTSLEEAYQIIGRPLGIGGSMYFLDQLIADTVGKEPYKSTRVWTVGQLLDNLKKGYPVPVRVGNATYRDDPSLNGGHYVVLIGFENGNAVLVDSDEPTGIFKCPWERFFSAMIQDLGLISAWDTTGIEKAKK